MKKSNDSPLNADDLRAYWRGTAEITGAEHLWGGLGGRSSLKIDGSTLTIEFPWLRRVMKSHNEPIEDPGERVRCFKVVTAKPTPTGDLRLHCGNSILNFRRRHR